MQNIDLIKTNIEEAKEELKSILSDLASDSEYSEQQFQIAREHAYHHLNFVWNIRKVEMERAENYSQEDYALWSKYPAGEIYEYE